jgi:hypothetical protein
LAFGVVVERQPAGSQRRLPLGPRRVLGGPRVQPCDHAFRQVQQRFPRRFQVRRHRFRHPPTRQPMEEVFELVRGHHAGLVGEDLGVIRAQDEGTDVDPLHPRVIGGVDGLLAQQADGAEALGRLPARIAVALERQPQLGPALEEPPAAGGRGFEAME